jgi:hypothetical protein
MLYETCARAEEILGVDVPDLDMEFRRAYVHWERRSAPRVTRRLKQSPKIRA